MNQKEIKSAEILIEIALSEDIGEGDITTESLVPASINRKAMMVSKADGVIAGLQVAEMVFRKLDKNLVWNPIFNDGDRIKKGDRLVEFYGTYRSLLTGERTALNFLQRMSGIATISAIFADELNGTGCQVLDTRKTLPGFRLLDKYSVRMGGASNHRTGLFDMVMIKDNHIKVAGGISKAIHIVRQKNDGGMIIEVETTTLDEVKEALDSGADIIMLDNMSIEIMREAVRLINGKSKTEASGNVNLSKLKEIASTGVDFISAGVLTHSVTALDISQKIIG